MSITFVQNNTKGYGGSLSLPFTSSNTAGNALFVGANVGYASSPTISDTLGNAYTLVQTTNNPNANTYTVLWYCPSCIAGANTVTIGGIGLVGSCTFGIAEFSGVNTLDKTAYGTGSGAAATWSSSSITTTVASELVIGCTSNGYGSLATASPFTTLSNETYFLMYYEIVNSTQTLTGTGTKRNSSGDAWTTTISSFYSSGGGGGTVVFVDNETPSGLINGTNNTFTLANTPSPASSFKLYQNGIRMAGGGSDYTLTGGSFSYTIVPQTNQTHVCDYRYNS